MALLIGLCATNELAQAATIEGNVSFGGAADPRLDASRVVVYLDGRGDLSTVPLEGQQVVQHDKAFNPNMLVVVQGTTVEFPNWDPFSHNVFSRSRAASFDLDRYQQGQSKSYTFNNVGVVQLFCNIHPQMKAVIVVVPNRSFARSDAQGRFVLTDVPPGPHTLVVWHERAGEQRAQIQVPAEGLRAVNLTLAAQPVRERSVAPTRRAPAGVERGLGVKRERLNLPVVGGQHAAPNNRKNP